MAKNLGFSTKDKFLQENSVIAIIINKEDIRGFAETKFLNCKTIDYVKEAFKEFEIREIFVNNDAFLINLLSPEVLLFDYVFLMYANLPLLTNKTVIESLEYFVNTKAAVCKLPSGYIINSAEYQKLQKNEVNETAPNFFCEEDFYEFKNINNYSKFFEALKNRIILKHIKNGVNIIDVHNVYIDKTVNIACGATIYPFCYLAGNVFIASGETIKPFSNISEN